MNDIEKIRKVLISRKQTNLANLFIFSKGELSVSSRFGSYLNSTISTYYIKSPLKNTDQLNALDEANKHRIFDAILSIYPH